ncbi:3,4-dihydroxy 2-butanone 4-phosphate synthase/GTP cyclohydrolase II [Sinobacterium caligoides]|uniref:3,4-dihydroxy-2-butanone 4-phosphate synthase n=1 Tax=Sinobacterium caligoides TaxID=933926 RepID=A0A3N2DPT1_9GAMM|nr:bifunctional 3,4-dihydroxy-2-butanone-4-phosphate synthase/GTP cyclohydrolase II [Sinobacterium caligoides]ROS01629.1 3,4-dihydroxy 2-butanone 4-phosphate synthase/GTP cyclohydrolase II [Sinobacterium caligoides]
MALNTAEEIINDIRLGKMVILMDDEDRENEGDLVIAAECVNAAEINFFATHARGLICLTLSEQRCAQLDLPLMVRDNGAQFSTNFTFSIEATSGVTTGISAADRAHTIRTAVARNAEPSDIVMPGHIFPLMAKPGGVLSRAGHTEAGCDLARLAGFEPAAAIVEIMNEDGTMARRSDLEVFAVEHDLKIGTIADLIHYRVANEKTIERVSVGEIDTDFGPFNLHSFRDTSEGKLHFALVKGDIKADEPTLVRVHLGSTVRDLMSAKIPGKEQGWNVRRCLERVAEVGKGVVLLVDNPESQEELLASVEVALGNQPKPKPEGVGTQNTYFTVGIGSQILREVGVAKIRLMGPPIKYNAISGFDLEVVEYEPVERAAE